MIFLSSGSHPAIFDGFQLEKSLAANLIYGSGYRRVLLYIVMINKQSPKLILIYEKSSEILQAGKNKKLYVMMKLVLILNLIWFSYKS